MAKKLRAIDPEILSDVVSSYDQNKTTTFGTVALKNINSTQCLSPSLMKYIDAVADTTLVPLMPERDSDYQFSTQGVATPVSVLCYYAPRNTDIKQYIGRINITTGTGALVNRGLKVVTTGNHTSGGTVTVFIGITSATAASAGVYQTVNVTFAHFTPAGTTIISAGIGETSASLVRVFKHEEDGTNGGGGSNLMTSINELFVDRDSGYLYVKNGSAATYQVYRFKYDVLLTSASAIGQTFSGFVGVNGFKTGNLGTSNPLAGTVLQNNSGKWAIPLANSGATAPHLNAACLFFSTTTTLYHGLVSDLAAGVTGWSLSAVNISGASGDQVNPTVIGFANFSVLLGRWCFTSNGRFYFKTLVNNLFDMILGYNDSSLLEAQPSKFPALGLQTITGMDITDGWMSLTSSVVGQRGILCVDLRNEEKFNTSYFITKVVQLNGDSLTAIQLRNLLRGASSSSKVYIRLSDNLADFATATSGTWIPLTDDLNMSIDANSNPIVSKKYGQLKVYSYISKNPTGIAPAVRSIRLITEPAAVSDAEWVGSLKHTSQPSASPFYMAYRLQDAYLNGMPSELIHEIIDDSGNVIQSLSTIADAANVSYTTTDGSSWVALGTIPNVALTTEVRFLISSPPTGKVRGRLRSA